MSKQLIPITHCQTSGLGRVHQPDYHSVVAQAGYGDEEGRPMSNLPAPLTTSDINLKGFHSFMLNTEELLASEFKALSTGDEFKAAILLLCQAWKQTPPASLPNDDRALAAFAEVSTKRWLKMKNLVLRGFILCSDGRLYHEALAQDAHRAFQRRFENKEKTKNATKARWLKRDVERDDVRDGERDVVRRGNVTTSQGQGQGELMAVASSSSPLIPGTKTTTAATSQQGDKSQDYPGDTLAKPDPKPAPTKLLTKEHLAKRIEAVRSERVKTALMEASLIGLLEAYGCTVNEGNAGEWAREAHSMQLGLVAVVLGWRMWKKDPVRLPSGLAQARKAWASLSDTTRLPITNQVMAAFGITVDKVPLGATKGSTP